MDSQHSCEQQPSNEPLLCLNSCGFFGNPATGGLCSKCHRESQANEQEKAKEASVDATNSTVPSPIASPKPSVEITTTPSPAAEPRVESESVPLAVVEKPLLVEPVSDQPEKPVQANKNRCFDCKKKIGLLGFECRCGYTYCSSHRHAADHACTFDYAGFDRERLAKANPLVAASKIDKM